MAKMKTHRGAAKRFRRTASGKLKRSRAFTSHLLGHKSPKRKRRLRKQTAVHPSDYKRIRSMLTYKK